MADITSAIRNTVPISAFNRGLAGKVFEEVRRSGSKVVMKNNAAECVLLSPEEYLQLMDEVNDLRLLALAAQRLSACDASEFLSEEEMDRRLGLSDADLQGFDEVELE